MSTGAPRQTKIVCTIGPATASRERIAALIKAGMNVARVNLSHGTHETHAQVITNVRELAAEARVPVAILLDLSGPKIRTGEVPNGQPILLESGAEIQLVEAEDSDPGRIAITYFQNLRGRLKPRDTIFVSDGRIKLQVADVATDQIRCTIEKGGLLAARQGFNPLGVSLGIPALTEKDILDLDFGVEQHVDYIALSFVQQPEDIRLTKERLEERGATIPVIAKIEKHEALECIDAIIDIADGVMVARGDLGVEIPLEDVPMAQKHVITAANNQGKPVITATQMLESMIENSRPTRAEVTDVANAILDGTDAVMLSGETAAGKNPIEAVEIMDRIALRTEAEMPYEEILRRRRPSTDDIPNAIAHAACHTALDIGARAIICCTRSGTTAQMVAKYRPEPLVIAATPVAETRIRLALLWGVAPILIDEAEHTDALMLAAEEAAKAARLIKTGDRVVFIAGAPSALDRNTNVLKADTIS